MALTKELTVVIQFDGTDLSVPDLNEIERVCEAACLLGIRVIAYAATYAIHYTEPELDAIDTEDA